MGEKGGELGYLEANVAVAVMPLEVLDPLLHDLRRQQRHRHLHSTAQANRRREGVSSSIEQLIGQGPYRNHTAAGWRMYLARRPTGAAAAAELERVRGSQGGGHREKG